MDEDFAALSTPGRLPGRSSRSRWKTVMSGLMLLTIVASLALFYFFFFNRRIQYFRARAERRVVFIAERLEREVSAVPQRLQNIEAKVADTLSSTKPFVRGVERVLNRPPDDKLEMVKTTLALDRRLEYENAFATVGEELTGSKTILWAESSRGNPRLHFAHLVPAWPKDATERIKLCDIGEQTRAETAICARMRLDDLLAVDDVNAQFDHLFVAAPDGTIVADVAPTGESLHHISRLFIGDEPLRPDNELLLRGRVEVYRDDEPHELFIHGVDITMPVLLGPAIDAVRRISDGLSPDANPERWLVGGLVRRDRLVADSMAVPYRPLIGFLLFLFAATLTWPILNLWRISRNERVTAADVFVLVVTAVAFLAFATLGLLQMSVRSQMSSDLDDELGRVSQKIAENFAEEIESAYLQLEQFFESELNVEYSWLYPRYPLSRLHFYPHGQFIFLTDEEGHQHHKWATGPETTHLISVDDRDFYQRIRSGRLFRAPSRSNPDKKLAFAVEFLLSSNTGEAVMVLAAPLPVLRGQGDGGSALAAGLVTRPISLFQAVLPMGTGFAIIDTQGMVLAHSEEHRTLSENFFHEVGASALLSAAARAREEIETETDYQGLRHTILLRPLPHLPFHLAVFRNEEPWRELKVSVLLLSALGILLYVSSFALAGMLVWNVAKPEWTRWLWPDIRRLPAYCGGAIVSVLLFVPLLREMLSAGSVAHLLFGPIHLATALAAVYLVTNEGRYVGVKRAFAWGIFGGGAALIDALASGERARLALGAACVVVVVALAFGRFLRVSSRGWVYAGYGLLVTTVLLPAAILPAFAVYHHGFRLGEQTLRHAARVDAGLAIAERERHILEEYESLASRESDFVNARLRFEDGGWDDYLPEALAYRRDDRDVVFSKTSIKNPVLGRLGRNLTWQLDDLISEARDEPHVVFRVMSAAIGRNRGDIRWQEESYDSGDGDETRRVLRVETRSGVGAHEVSHCQGGASLAAYLGASEMLPFGIVLAILGTWLVACFLTSCLFLVPRVAEPRRRLGWRSRFRELGGSLGPWRRDPAWRRKFLERECALLSLPEAAERIRRQARFNSWGEDRIVEEVLREGDARFAAIWQARTQHEKLVLKQLADSGFVNPKNGDALIRLRRENIIRLTPAPRMTESFRRYVAVVSLPEGAQALESMAERGGWRSWKIPVFGSVILGSMAFVLLGGGNVGGVVAFLGATATAVQGLPTLIGALRSMGGPPATA